MHKPEFVLENETHKILKDFEIQTDQQIMTRKTDMVLFNKEKKNGFCRYGGIKRENKRPYRLQYCWNWLESSEKF